MSDLPSETANGSRAASDVYQRRCRSSTRQLRQRTLRIRDSSRASAGSPPYGAALRAASLIRSPPSWPTETSSVPWPSSCRNELPNAVRFSGINQIDRRRVPQQLNILTCALTVDPSLLFPSVEIAGDQLALQNFSLGRRRWSGNHLAHQHKKIPLTIKVVNDVVSPCSKWKPSMIWQVPSGASGIDYFRTG